MNIQLCKNIIFNVLSIISNFGKNLYKKIKSFLLIFWLKSFIHKDISNLELFKILIWSLVLGICTIYSAIIPPIQSPDETSHLASAYLLSKGRITFITPPGQDSGGYIDSGLLEFIASYTNLPFRPNHKLNYEMTLRSQSIRWTGDEKFIPVRSSPYFPLIYAPSAIGLAIGKIGNLSVEQSYRIGRFISTFTCLGVIAFAFSIYQTNMLSVLVLSLPMSLFQLTTINADALSLALIVLISSITMRGIDKEKEYQPWMSYILGLSLFAVITARWQLVPLSLLLIIIWLKRKQPIDILTFLFLCIGFTLWFVYAWLNYRDSRIIREFTSDILLKYYILHPLHTLKIIGNTIVTYKNSYIQSFIGVLGWLDTPFSSTFYKISILFLIIATGLSISFQNIRKDYKERLFIQFLILCIILFTFLALLVTWSPFPTERIEGIQGRYFLSPMVLMGYVLRGTSTNYRPIQTKISYLLICIWTVFIAYFMTRVLIFRYLVS
ncbi:MAG: DUF2142 domain-containing protein [Thermanaerothrix sp.]|uniref:DUF2142 domain-containing protein n=1 Tax=Thermanaerothrix sp. TaxID=2972675 RepID=UPI003C7DB67E